MRKQWYRLDNAALIFPAIIRRNWNNVFRVAVTLTEPVDPEILSRAAADLKPRFPTAFVRLKAGFFWYHLETVREALRAEQVSPGVLHYCEYPFRAADGRDMWLRAYINTVRSEKRFLAYCNIVDITARHKASKMNDTKALEMR